MNLKHSDTNVHARTTAGKTPGTRRQGSTPQTVAHTPNPHVPMPKARNESQRKALREDLGQI